MLRTLSVLLTALVLAGQPGADPLQLEIEGHGRGGLAHGPDVSRAVGWFTAIYPLTLPQVAGVTIVEALAAVRALLDRVPRGGIGYRPQPNPDAAAQTEPPPCAGILFNYLGRMGRPTADSVLHPTVPLRLSRAASTPRRYTWEVNAWIDENGLRIDWGYSDELDSATRMRALADGLAAQLRAVLQSAAEAARAPRASDFPLAGLNDEKLSKLAVLLGSSAGDG